MKASKVLIGIVIVLLVILVSVIFKIVDSKNMQKEELNKDAQQSSIKDRRNALKEVFK